MAQTMDYAPPMDWMASSCRAGARSLKVSEAAATAARQPGGGRREGETYVTTKQNKALPKPYSATQKPTTLSFLLQWKNPDFSQRQI